MIALPFLYFSIWFYKEYRKRGFDVYSFILLLYTVISFFSILIDWLDLYYDSCPKMPTLGYIAPFLYILLLTICVEPFSRFRSNSIEKLVGISEKKFNWVVCGYFIIFLIVIIVSATRIQEIITSNALAEVRREQYRGEAVSFYDHLSGIPRYICAICYMLSPSSYLMILFFFIGITHFHKGLFFSIVTLCSSLTMLLIAINIADRSNFAYWGLTFILCYIFFRQHFTNHTRRVFIILASLLAFVMIAYLAVVTIARFGESEDGSAGGIITYLGMSYINFCNFFNYLVFDVPHKPEIVLLPNVNEYILEGPTYFEYMDRLYRYYHHNLSTFSTFIGFIMSVAGFWITVFYCVIYRVIAKLAIRRKAINSISIRKLFLFWIVVLNPVLGLFTYYYHNTLSVLNIVIWWIIGVFISTSFRISKINYIKL